MPTEETCEWSRTAPDQWTAACGTTMAGWIAKLHPLRDMSERSCVYCGKPIQIEKAPDDD